MHFDPPAHRFKSLAAKGAIYTGVAQAVKVALQFVSVIVLARLLAPEDFGVVAMAAPILAFVTLVQNLGLTQGVIQKPDLKEHDVNSVFWINVAVSLLLVVILNLSAPFIAGFYKEETLAPFIMALSAVVLCSGLNTIHEALLNRKMAFGHIAFAEITAALLALSVSIGVALYVPNYWALFFGLLAGVLWTVLCFWRFSKWVPNRPAICRESFSILRFGAGVTGFNIVNFFERNLDNILIGRVWGSAQLGLYDRAYKLLIFPLQQITNPLGKVIIPILSRIVEEPVRYKHVFLKAHGLVIWIALPGVIFLLMQAGTIIPLLLGRQWADVVPVFQMLAYAGLLQPINNPSGWLYVSQGRGKEFAVAGTVCTCITISALIVGLPYGIIGVAMTYAFAQVFKTPFIWWYAMRRGPVSLRDIAGAIFPFLCAIGGTLCVMGMIQDVFAHRIWFSLSISLIMSYLVFSLITLCFAHGRFLMREAALLGRDLVAKTSSRYQ